MSTPSTDHLPATATTDPPNDPPGGGPPARGIDLPEMLALLERELGLDLAGVTEDALLADDLGWDSLTFMELLAVGDRLGLSLPDDLVRSWRTVGDVHHAIDAHLRHSANPDRAPASGLRGGTTQLVAVHRGHDDLLWRLHIDGDHLVDYRLRGRVPSPEAFRAMVWEGVLAQFLVALDDGRVLGLVSAVQPDFRNRHAHVAVIVEPEWRDTGLVIDGLARFLSYLFTQFDLRKVYAEVLERNLGGFASGDGRFFTVEGRMVDHEYVDGGYEDMLLLATTRERWRQVHERLFGEPPRF